MRILKILAALCLSFSAAHGATVSGVTIPDTLSVDGQTLVLNGAGVRSRFVFDVYVGALYTSTPSQDADAIISATTPRAMTLTLMRDVDADSLLSAMKTGLRDNHDNAGLAALEPATQALETIVRRIGNGKKGDRIVLALTADALTLLLNDQELGRIDDARMPAAMLRIWLGARPADKRLKQALLGLPQS